MIRNALLTIGFLWFSLAPTLCAAGVLPHVCESFRFLGSEHSCVDGEDGHYEEHCSQGCNDDGSSHDRSSHDPCTHDDFVCIHDGCSHDACSHDACVNDPYLVRDLVQKDRTRDFQFSGLDAFFVSAALPVHPYFITSPRPCVHCRVQAAGKNIPFHASDIPLLA